MQFQNVAHALCAISVSATASVALAAGQAAAPDATNAVADAVKTSDFVPVFNAEAERAEPGVALPQHPPIDQIPPTPMPDPLQAGEHPGGGPGNILVHDAMTGVTQEIPMEIWSNRGDGDATGGGFVGADGVDTLADLYGPRGFGTMFELSDNSISTFPFRMNAKLVQEYTDAGNGNQIYFVCSGAMQDPEVVFTAGHCVYNRDNDSTGNDYGFASRVWAYPGWDGNGLTLGNPGVLDYYGWGVATNFVAWTGYTQSGDFDADIGFARLSRAVGMLTGWYGWRSVNWNTCGTTGLFFNNPSFPSEGCGQTGLHNGRDMYNWNGNFDSCQGSNQLRINTTPGCFTALWGGQSGSNAYDIVDDSRFAHAVASNSNRTTIGQYAKLWTEAREYLNDTFKPGARGSALDLQSLDTTYDQTSILAGDTLTGGTAVIPNPTDNNPLSDTYGLSVRLSTNNNISDFDTNMGSGSFTYNYGAMQNLTVNMYNVTVPKNTPSGTYWVGVLLDDGIDADDSNNDPDLWDAHELDVEGLADIVANTCSAPSGTVYHGDSISVGYNVTNEGGDPSNSVTLDFYASTNTDISTFDTYLGSVNIGTFSGDQTKSGSHSVTIPSSITGTRYIGYIANASDDFYVNQDNEAFDSVALTIDGRADLFANYITALDSEVAIGGSTDVRYNIQNNGTISSGTYNVRVYASTNTDISGIDTLLGTFAMPSLGVGGSDTDIRTASVPAFMSPGLYYIGMIVEGGDNENSLGDNEDYDPNRVNFIDCPVDFDSNGLYDLADIVDFTQFFSNQDPRADLNNDGLFDLGDVVAFVDFFTAGCP